MYRTYRNLYKVQPEITSIGQGKQRIKLPRDTAITVDSFVLFGIFLLPARFILTPIVSLLVNPDGWPIDWPIAILLAGGGAFYAGKLDPAGKSISSYLWGVCKFFLRSRYSNGWEKKEPMKRSIRNNAVFGVTLLDDGKTGSLPATGRVEYFELRLPAAVKVRGGRVTVKKRGSKLPAGSYKIEKGRVLSHQDLIPKAMAPSLKRH